MEYVPLAALLLFSLWAFLPIRKPAEKKPVKRKAAPARVVKAGDFTIIVKKNAKGKYHAS